MTEKEEPRENIIKVGGKNIMKITTRLKRVAFSDWKLQRHYRFQLIVLGTLVFGGFLTGISITGLFIQNLPKPAYLVLQAVSVGIMLYLIWKLQKEDEKLRRIDAMVHGLNTKYTTEQILDAEDKVEISEDEYNELKDIKKRYMENKRRKNTTGNSP